MTVLVTTISMGELGDTRSIKCKDFDDARRVVAELQAKGGVVGCIKCKDKIKFVF